MFSDAIIENSRKLLLIKSVKSPQKKKLVFFFCEFCLTSRNFYGIGRIGREMLGLPYAGFFLSAKVPTQPDCQGWLQENTVWQQ